MIEAYINDNSLLSRKRHRQRNSSMLVCSALALSAPAAAQQVAAPAPQAEAQAASPEGQANSAEASGEIVVTAQKRTENVQDVPKSVAVASQVTLDRQGVSRLTDLQAVFPSLTITNQTQNAKPPGIRGITTFANATSVQAKTGIVIDDIPQPTFSTLANELSDVERVEVFAGPQSTLSGRNAAGGLINFVTRAPSQIAQGEFHAEQTTDRQTRLSAFVTAPISSTLAFSLSGVYNKWSGPLRNIALDTRLGGFDSQLVRGKLRWRPSDKFTATVTGYYSHNKRKTPPFVAGGAYINVTPGATSNIDAQTPKRTFEQLYPGITPSAHNRELYSLQDGTAKTKDYGGSLRLDYDLGPIGSISSLSDYQRSAQPRNDIVIGSPQTNVSSTITGFNAVTDVQTKYWSQELRLVSPGNQTFTYLLGAIYTDSDLFQPYYRPGIFAFSSDRTASTKSVAVFGRGTLNVTPADALTGGLRYQHDRIGYTWRFYLGPPGAYTEGTSGYGFVGGELSYKHNFSRDFNAYATFSHSESGRAYDIEDNATAAVRPLTPLASEKVNNVEIGFKSQLIDRRLTLNANVYRADYKNYQVQTIDSSNPNVAPVIRLLAIGKVRTQGIEVTTSFRASSALRLGVSGIYNDAKIRDYPLAACYTRQTAAQGCTPAVAATATTQAIPANQGNLKGRSLPAAPRWKINASADYTAPFDIAGLAPNVGATYRYESKSNFVVTQDPSLEQKAFSIVNLYAGLETHEGRYNVQLFVNNLFNKVFYSNISNESQFNGRSVNYDRNSFRYGGIRASAKF